MGLKHAMHSAANVNEVSKVCFVLIHETAPPTKVIGRYIMKSTFYY